MSRSRLIAALAFASLSFAFTAGASLSASAQGCGPWNNWCMPQCGDWNNWCQNECWPLEELVPRAVRGRGTTGAAACAVHGTASARRKPMAPVPDGRQVGGQAMARGGGGGEPGYSGYGQDHEHHGDHDHDHDHEHNGDHDHERP